MRYWTQLSNSDQMERIQKALTENVNFNNDYSLGYPASKLDGKVFFDEAPFLKEAPLLTTFVANPNHIGCHTLGTSEEVFKGTQDIEREVLNILATDVFHCEDQMFDGYIAPGGTEANIEALWIYRNYFQNEFRALPEEIAILASEDTHYSIPKGSNLLGIERITIPVSKNSREVLIQSLEGAIDKAVNRNKKYFIVVANMGTTMFGSVDSPDVYISVLENKNLHYKLHIDAAYGGFVYPFTTPEHNMHFGNPKISSITVDAHKMLQAPYGTGVFLCRKGLINNVLTPEAEYVEGMDVTLCGSRSGANAVAVWMILTTYGPEGWRDKIRTLQLRTDWLCNALQNRNIEFYRNPGMNIVTIPAWYVSETVARKFNLVPDKHNETPDWYKIVLMEHVEINDLKDFLKDIDAEKMVCS